MIQMKVHTTSSIIHLPPHFNILTKSVDEPMASEPSVPVATESSVPVASGISGRVSADSGTTLIIRAKSILYSVCTSSAASIQGRSLAVFPHNLHDGSSAGELCCM